MSGGTVTEAGVCFRKFVEERRACRGRMRSHHVMKSEQGCCRKHGQGFAEQVEAITHVLAELREIDYHLVNENDYLILMPISHRPDCLVLSVSAV